METENIFLKKGPEGWIDHGIGGGRDQVGGRVTLTGALCSNYVQF